jgi:hypothetical protein
MSSTAPDGDRHAEHDEGDDEEKRGRRDEGRDADEPCPPSRDDGRTPVSRNDDHAPALHGLSDVRTQGP